MSKISLRAYNREIETLIERGHTEEAIAHCKYILKTYAKHLDTYRLLGKAFLESQRYGEAADILNRILSVIPDDFVAQIGMSIIREDEGNLDAAIFHMERAFEIQPSNAAIQDELRRLYGRRDGIEPPKLRLTRGALVRMYARGDLYRQAIAEARAAIKEDPQRLDLEIVLALMYYQTGQKAEAAEICSRLVMKLPFCMEANRILANVLPETSRSDDAKIYQQRLVALEPYLGYQTDPSQSVQQIPDNAVTLDRLEWIPSLESSQQPAWANNLGLEIEEKEEVQSPDWLSGLATDKTETVGEENAPQPFVQEQEPSQAPFTSATPETTEPSLETPVDQVTKSPEAVKQPAPETGEELPDWMRELGETPAVSEEDKLPDWMKDMGETSAAAEEEVLPDWMQSSGWKVSESSAEIPSEELTTSPEIGEAEESVAAPADIPDWLKDLAPTPKEEFTAQEPTPEVEIPAESVEIPAVEDTVKSTTAASIDEELPDWIKPPVTSTEESISAQNQEPLPDWLMESPENLETLAEAPTSTENVIDTEGSIAETQPVAAQPDNEMSVGSIETGISAVPDETIPVTTPDVENVDDAMAWLESLAAKQGADEETLITKPEDRVETPPEWVAQAAATLETPAASHEQELTPEAIEQQEVPEESISQMIPAAEELTAQVQSGETMIVGEEPTAVAEEVTAEPTAEAEPIATEEIVPPEPVTDLELVTVQENIPSEPTAQVEPIVSEETDQADMDSAFAWLESLAAKQGAEPDTLLVSSEERLENPPDWIQQESTEIETEAELEGGEQGTGPVEETSEPLPDWMASTEPVESSVAEMPPSEVSLPDWLKDESVPQETVEGMVTPAEENIPVSTEEEKLSIELPASEEIETDWVKEEETVEPELQEPVGQISSEPAVEKIEETPVIETLPESREPEPLPDWLASDLSTTPPVTEEIPEQEFETPALPDWLQTETPVSEITPEEVSVTADEGEAPPLPDWLKDLEAEQEEEPLPIEGGFNLAPVEAEKTGEISENPDEMILQAQNALNKGQIEFSISIYQRLIEQDQKLDETIHDLRDALYRFPVDSVIWQMLGDAYMRNNQVQPALDAFTKAEELIK
jgi:tetratricopeptide (TPR) repeat protein